MAKFTPPPKAKLVGKEYANLHSLFMHRKYNSTPTKSELRVKELLSNEGIRFQFQKGLFYKKGKFERFYIADFYLPKKKIIIEVDGSIHNQKKIIENDKRKDAYYTNIRKFKVLRVKNENIEHIVSMIYDLMTLPKKSILRCEDFLKRNDLC